MHSLHLKTRFFRSGAFCKIPWLVLVLVLISNPILIHGTSEDEYDSDLNGEGGVDPHKKKDMSNASTFSHTGLDVSELLGSRWVMDQNKRINVYHSLEIVDASVIFDNSELSLRIEFYLQQRWTVESLVFPEGLFKPDDPPNFFITAKDTALKHMWHPNSYVSTSRTSIEFGGQSTPIKTKVYIYPNKTIIYRARMYAFVACTSNFEWYPVDKQACTLRFEGFTFHDGLVNYYWEEEEFKKAISLQIERPLQYDLEEYTRSNGSMPRGGIGLKFPYVAVKFIFERKLGNSLIQVYVPTTLVVMLSWLSFWMGLDAIPGRITMLITAMLNLVTMHLGVKNSIPPVHYVTLMDIWMVTCMLFVFAAICELITVKYFYWTNQKLHLPVEYRKAEEEEHEKKKFDDWLRIVQLQLPVTSSSMPLVTPPPGSQQSQAPSFVGDEEERPLATEKIWVIPKEKTIYDHGDVIKRKSSDGFDDNDDPSLDDSYRDPEAQKCDQGKCKCWSVFKCKCIDKDIWIKIDMIARGGFPTMFFIFNCVYWPIMLQSCDAQGSVYTHMANPKTHTAF